MLSQNLKRSIAILSLMLATGIVGNQAAAIEEVVVYGTDTSTTESDALELRARMREYMQMLHEQQKAKLDAEIAARARTRIQTAAGEAPTRG